jgi:hypothetical protein
LANLGEMVFYAEVRYLDPEAAGATVIVQSDLMAPADAFGDALSAAVDGVEVDGAPIFSAVDELEVELEGDGGNERDPDDGRDPDDEDGRDRDDADGRNRNEAGAGETDDADERGGGDNGLIGETAYESPSHGYSVTWSDGWIVDPSRTTTEGDADYLDLICPTQDCEVRVIGTAAEWTPEQVVDLYVEDFLASTESLELVDLGVVDGVAYALLEDVTDAGTAILYVEARSFDQVIAGEADGVLVTTMLSTGEGFERNFASAIDEIEVDGNPVFAAPGQEDLAANIA